MPIDSTDTTRSAPSAWLILAAALVALKLLLGVFDPTIRFFLGDSESYLHSALTGWIPPDRSFVYPAFLHVSAVAAGSLTAMLVVQSLCGVLTALLSAHIAAGLGVAWRYAAMLAVIVALEPAQLFYERMVMAESLGTLCLITMIACGMAYLRCRDWRWLLPMALAGTATVALRMSLLPIVLGFALLPPVIARFGDRGRTPWRKPVLHLAIALVATGIAHAGYQRLYGYVADTKPTYLRTSGTFRLGLIAPLVKPEHLERYGVSRQLLDALGPNLHEPLTREQQLWSPDGLIHLLKRELGDERTEVVARKIAARALRDDLPGYFAMQAGTVADYFDPAVIAPRLDDDLGTRPLSDSILSEVREQLNYDAAGVHERRNPIARYFDIAAPWWLTFCLFALAPLVVIALVRSPRERRTTSLLFALAACGLVTGHYLFSHIVSFRYLHPFAPLVLIALAAAFTPRVGRSTSATTRS